jgi:hypothetical protein
VAFGSPDPLRVDYPDVRLGAALASMVLASADFPDAQKEAASTLTEPLPVILCRQQMVSLHPLSTDRTMCPTLSLLRCGLILLSPEQLACS